jgi:hypothetical protein
VGYEGHVIRIRRLPRRALRRAKCEIELTESGTATTTTTPTPVTLLDPHLGVGDAWALVGAADDAAGGWVTWPPTG